MAVMSGHPLFRDVPGVAQVIVTTLLAVVELLKVQLLDQFGSVQELHTDQLRECRPTVVTVDDVVADGHRHFGASELKPVLELNHFSIPPIVLMRIGVR